MALDHCDSPNFPTLIILSDLILSRTVSTIQEWLFADGGEKLETACQTDSCWAEVGAG